MFQAWGKSNLDGKKSSLYISTFYHKRVEEVGEQVCLKQESESSVLGWALGDFVKFNKFRYSEKKNKQKEGITPSKIKHGW